MLCRVSFFFAHLFVCAVANTALYTPENFIKLTLGVSKATYFTLESGRFLQNGLIMENPSFSSFKDIPEPEDDERACRIGDWTVKSYENGEAEILMFTNDEQKLVVFGFRGTDATNIKDWNKNFDIAIVKETIGSDSFRVHKGFLARYDFISSWFENEYSHVPNDYTILLTGHSSGGAQATIAAVYAAGKLNRIPDAVVTYGSPKVGNKQFKEYYQKVVGCDRTIRMTVRFDPAPSFPAHILWYTHVCKPLEVLGKFTLNPLYKHSLYGGYEDGIEKKYRSMNEIKIGCDKKIDNKIMT